METVEATRVAYTYCDLCNQVPKCGMKVHVEGGRIVRVEDRENYPAGPLCVKGLASLEEQYHPDRLLYPVARSTPKGSPAPGWQRISWDEAYRRIAAKLDAVKAKYGADKVCFFVGDPKEPRPAVQRLAYTFGSPNFGTESSLCSRSAVMASQLTFGTATTGNLPSQQSGSCLIWSRNPVYSAPHEMARLLQARKQGVKYVIVDPRVTPTVRQLADVHLQPRPGTDGALALGMVNLMLQRDGLCDRGFAAQWIEGLDELARYAGQFSLEEVERITWVPRERIEAAVQLLARSRPVTWVGSSQATVHSSNGFQNHRAILAVLALIGDFDAPGGVTLPTYPLSLLPFGYTTEFTREAELLPGLSDKRLDKDRFPLWARMNTEIQMNHLPEYVEQGRVKAMVMFGANAMIWPQTAQYQQAIAKLDFSVAADYFLRPWTHDHVDMVLPAATTFERMSPVAIFGRRVFLRDPVVAPSGEAKPDWLIALELGCRLGYASEFWHGDESQALDAILRKEGLSVEALRAAGAQGIRLPAPGEEVFRKYEKGLLRRDRKPGFNTPSGKIELKCAMLEEYGFDPLPRYREPVESPLSTPDLAREFPLVLNTGSRVLMFTHSKLRELPSLRKLMPFPVINLHPRDASAQGISQGDEVELESAHGRIRLRAHLSSDLLPGVVDVSHGWADANVNEVVPRHFDPITGFAAFKEGLCRVRKVGG
ncbi:MAG: molybdopterin oxidoreductase [Betaproteobacteria bacterium RIFCSPLOWO2_02_FULL_65_24]|nr:MAG: molybdopterin oxidoreductase [Betaproteobacteria bacterium RIFCSPLOWO2_02_FULL_65_24]